MQKGVVSGNEVGKIFKGKIYEKKGNMYIKGKLMKDYGVKSIFGEVKILGEILGNGSDRGMIGINYKIVGNEKKKKVIVKKIQIIEKGILS